MRHETAAAAFTYRTLGGCLNRCTQREKRSEGGGGGEFISVRDATRRAKMKADGAGAATVIQGPACSTNRRNTLDSRQRGRETCLLMFEEEG